MACVTVNTGIIKRPLTYPLSTSSFPTLSSGMFFCFTVPRRVRGGGGVLGGVSVPWNSKQPNPPKHMVHAYPTLLFGSLYGGSKYISARVQPGSDPCIQFTQGDTFDSYAQRALHLPRLHTQPGIDHSKQSLP